MNDPILVVDDSLTVRMNLVELLEAAVLIYLRGLGLIGDR